LTRDRLRPYYFIAAGVLLQGLSPVLTKLLLSDLSAASVVGARYLIAVLFLLPFGWKHKTNSEWGPPRPRDWVALFLVGALGSGVASLLFTQAIFLTSAGVATALSKTAPIFVAFFAYFTLRERITSGRLLLVLMMVGADVLIGAGEMTGSLASQRLMGDFMAIGAGVLRAMAEILSKTSLRRFYPSTVSMWRFGIGFLVTGAIAFFSGQYRALYILNLDGWLLLLALGGLCTALSMTLYYRGLKDIPAHVGVSLRLLSAIVTVLVSWLVLRETLNGLHLAGIAVLVAGAYLIVVKTTKQPVLAPALEAARPAPSLSPTRTLRGRVALLVSVMIAVTVMTSTILSIQHTRAVLYEQVRLTMVKTATMILQLRGVAQPPSAETYRQYLDRIIHHHIEGRFYSVEIMYLMVLDGQGNVIAFAKQDALPIKDAQGHELPNYSPVTALRLLELTRTGELKREWDIVPLSADLEQDGRITGVVKMGSKRSLAQRGGMEIALRNLSLAVLLILLGIFVSYRLTEHLAKPLEKLSTEVRRISNGELDVPLVPIGSLEIESLGRSVARMADELREGQMLRDSLAAAICPAAAPELPSVTLLARLGGSTADEQMAQFEALLETVARNEGTLAAFAPGHLLATFGGVEPEQDDVLRAVVAALEWRAYWLDVHAPDPSPAALVEVASGNTAPERLEILAQQLASAPAATGLPIYLTQAAYVAASHHVQTVPAGDLYLLDEPESGSRDLPEDLE
jgi:drug/metabolite transporter (DMT)-like permease/HAMP domain-containing protein